MTVYYLDSSAVVKRYVAESGSEAIRAICADAENALFLSELALVEVSSAFARRAKGGGISDAERRSYVDLFVGDCARDYALIPADRRAIDRAVALTQAHALRGYDALQLACALVASDLLRAAGVEPVQFLSADDELLAAAGTEGLAVANPNWEG
jgi:predicted nucleic acid-binding protein